MNYPKHSIIRITSLRCSTHGWHITWLLLGSLLAAHCQDGRSLATAIPLGSLTTSISRSGSLNPTNSMHFYSFEISNMVRDVSITIAGASHTGYLELHLLADRDEDGLSEQFDLDAQHAGRNLSTGAWLDPGIYYVMVNSGDGVTTGYELVLSQIPKPRSRGLGDNQLLAAQSQPPLEFGSPVVDHVSAADTEDFHLITISNHVSAVSATIKGASHQGYVVLNILADEDGNGIPEVLSSDAQHGGRDLRTFNWLNPGTYFVQVVVGAGYNTEYELLVSQTPKPSSLGSRDDLFHDAPELPPTPYGQAITDFVGVSDPIDYYRFVVKDHVSAITATIAGSSHDGYIQLSILSDSDEDGLPEVLDTAGDHGGRNLATGVWLDPGVYYLEVRAAAGYNTEYQLLLSQVAKPDSKGNGDNSPGDAADLGFLTGTRQLSDFVGSSDPADFYRFTVSGPARRVSAAIPAGSHNGYLTLSLHRDSDQDGILEQLEVDANHPGRDVKVERICQPGDYFIRILPSGNTLYDLIVARNFTNNTPAFIISSPSDLMITSGRSASFSVIADGSSTLSYQWLVNGKAVAGATRANVTFRDEVATVGTYEIVAIVSNAYGSVRSAPASLVVSAGAIELVIDPAQLISWPSDGTAGYQLQTSPSPSGPWTALDRPLVTIGSRIEAAVRVEKGARFFRLFKAN